MTKQFGKKETEIMDFLHSRIFDPILQSPHASEKLKQGVRGTVMRMKERDAAGMVQYYWSAIVGTERSIGFAALMRVETVHRALKAQQRRTSGLPGPWPRSAAIVSPLTRLIYVLSNSCASRSRRILMPV